MMLKKCSRRSATCFAIACLTFAVVSLWGPKEANTTSFFSGSQQWEVTSTGFSLIATYNFNTGTWSVSDWVFGNAVFTYSLPFGTNRAFYLFDHDSQRWTENIYLQDGLL